MGKYYYAYYSDKLNLKEDFTNYCFKEFIAFLEDSNSDELNNKLDIVLKDPEKMINKFVRENLPRLHLFIDKHYREEFNYNYDPFIAQLLEYRIPFNEEHSDIQIQYLTDNYRTYYINFLKDARIIQCDNWYIPQKSTLYAEGKSLGYRLHPRLYSSHFTFRKKRIRVKEVILKNYLNPKFKQPKEEKYPEYIENIREMTSAIQFDYKGFYKENSHSEDFDNHLKQLYSFHERCESKYLKRDTHIGRRINTPVTNLKSSMRNYLYFDDPNEGLSLVEISNCYHYCFSTYLLNYMIPEDIDEELKCILIKASEFLSQNLDGEFRNLGFAGLLRTNINNGFFTTEDRLKWERIDKCLNDSEFEKLVSIIDNEEFREYILFALLSFSGRIYDVMMELDSKTFSERKDFKKRFNMLFNLDNNVHWGVVEFAKTYFPKVHKDLMGLKRQSHKNYYHQMTQLESNLMIDNVSRELVNAGYKFANLHDGIICKSEDAEYIRSLVVEKSQQLYEYPAPVRIETIREEKKNVYGNHLAVA